MKLSDKYYTFSVPLGCLLRLKRRMRWVRAAGGIVTDAEGRMLLIRRGGRWDLPKGKVEAGETLLQAALREVEEETGVKVESGEWGVDSKLKIENSNLKIENTLTQSHNNAIKTYHIFNLYGGWHLKQTSWFAMRARGGRVAPQEEEGITEVVWVTRDEWCRRLRHSYGTMKTLSREWTR